MGFLPWLIIFVIEKIRNFPVKSSTPFEQDACLKDGRSEKISKKCGTNPGFYYWDVKLEPCLIFSVFSRRRFSSGSKKSGAKNCTKNSSFSAKIHFSRKLKSQGRKDRVKWNTSIFIRCKWYDDKREKNERTNDLKTELQAILPKLPPLKIDKGLF